MHPGMKCNVCNLVCTENERTEDGYYADPCLGVLPGVIFACCGHGKKDYGYVAFENGATIRFDLIISEFQKFSKHNNFIGRE